MTDLAFRIANNLTRVQWTVATVESATGGMISEAITRIPGSSAYFSGSLTAYRNDIKTDLLGIDSQIINRFGAVSRQVAEGMAQAGRMLFKADVCISDTGIAGPGGGTPEKPVGLLYFGLADSQRVLFRTA